MWIGDPEIKDILTTKEESATRLTKLQKSLPGLLGYGITRNSPESISVLVESITPEIESMFRAGIRGQPVTVVEVGHVVALRRTSEYNPIVGGISIGHTSVTAGTLGATVYDKVTGAQLILSNAHVLSPPSAQSNDPITQPGSIDGGEYPEDHEATLLRWVNLHEDNNLIDAAVATPTKPPSSDEIIDIGYVCGVTTPEIGMHVKKSGRTTGLTHGEITDTDVTISVEYGDAKRIFTNQFITSAMSAGGDSGSLCLESDTNKAVGLLFAGSDKVTIFNDINDVLDLLDVEFATHEHEPEKLPDAIRDELLAELLEDPMVIAIGVTAAAALVYALTRSRSS